MGPKHLACTMATRNTPKVLLDLNDDVLFQVCLAADYQDKNKAEGCPSTLLDLSSSCRRLRDVATSLVFRKATVSDFHEGRSRLPSIEPWLTFMESDELFLRHVRILDATFFVMLDHDAEQLLRILTRMTNLRELRLITPESREKTQVTLQGVLTRCILPALKSLILSAGLEALAAHFCTITSLQIKSEHPWWSINTDSFQLMASKGQFQKLQHLELYQTTDWSPHLLSTLSTHVPQLQSLGTIWAGRPGYSFEALFRSTKLFPLLQELRLGRLTNLGIRHFDPACVSRRPCMMPNWFCGEHFQDGVRYAAQVVFSACQHVRVLHFENEAWARCSRADDGKVVEIYLGNAMQDPSVG